MTPSTDPIGTVLAAYRSTAAHITQDTITAAWALYDRIRLPVLKRIEQATDVHPCHDCGLPTNHATGSYWLADDALWREVMGKSTFVLCPACFHDHAQGRGIAVSWRAVRDATSSTSPRATAVSERSDIIGVLVDAQAELQTALGIYRMGSDRRDFDPYVEKRMQASLAMQHEALEALGHPMAQPTQMPDNWTPA